MQNFFYFFYLYLKNIFFSINNIYCIRNHHFYGGDLNSESFVVDLGGNRGDFSVEVNKIFRCKVYVVEPATDLFRVIPETRSIKKFNYAITDKNGPVTLYLANDPETNTIEPFVQQMWKHEKSVTVSGITLEDFLKEVGVSFIDLMKVDIEGAEARVFRSVSGEVIRNIKQICLEMHDFVQPDNKDYVKSYIMIKRRFERLGFILIPFGLKDNDMDLLFLNKKYFKKIKHKLLICALSIACKMHRLIF